MRKDTPSANLRERDFLELCISLVGVLCVGRSNTSYRVMYRLRLHNTSGTSVRLLGRKWTLRDISGNTRIIEGAQVFNDTPVLQPRSIYMVSGYHEFDKKPTGMEVRFFGVDQGNAPFISPALVFPRPIFDSIK